MISSTKDKKMEKSNKESGRSDYWNEGYFEYWKARVDEANQEVGEKEKSVMVKGDTLTSTDFQLEGALHRLVLKSKSTILEIGCGFGRSLPILSKLCKQVYATDISEKMISIAKETNKSPNIKYLISEAESLNLKSNQFDYILCYAVFDALNQESALKEFNRLLKKGGRLLITGKNFDYAPNDNLAMEAEIAARRKKHPNFFTDVKTIFAHQDDFGFLIISQRFFVKRGDFMKDIFVTDIPDIFYEFELILEKTTTYNSSLIFSSKHSKTFLQKQSEK
jgi:ubiquinone/menaquinone biosynthesis C-methylase UbiE